MGTNTRETLEQENPEAERPNTIMLPHHLSDSVLCQVPIRPLPLILDSPRRLVLKSASEHMKASCPRLISLPSGNVNFFWKEGTEVFFISMS